MKPPIKDLQNAIAQTISDQERAQDVVEMCSYFGLQTGKDDSAWGSKRLYVISLIKDKSEDFLIDLAMKVYERYQVDSLKIVLNKFTGGVSGEIKNIIFAANGYKPDLVLTDAIHNTIDIAANAEFCLVYDKPVTSKGLLWSDLIVWWEENNLCWDDEGEQELYDRLKDSLGSEVEKYLFCTYYDLFKPKLKEKLPALIPQVYFHYDPKTLKQLQGKRRIPRERMDFLILFSDRDRVVLEVDGVHHYSRKDSSGENIASPQEYAQMVSEDRKLRLRGYEVYRFGGFELFNFKSGQVVLRDFFYMLFEKHGIEVSV